MNDQTAKLLEKLAEKLGTTGEYLWSVLLKQAYVSGVKSVIYLILLPVALYLVYRLFMKSYSAIGENEFGDEFAPTAGTVISCILGLVLIGFGCEHLVNAINAFLNPEFWALNYILDKI